MSKQSDRYHRQALLAGIGEQGQYRLTESTVLVLGCGALGSVAADLLARAGVGRLIIADRDFVELTNLQRQVLFDERDIEDELPKAEAARRRLARVNSDIEVVAVVDDINADNIERLAADADLLIDGLDNFETRYLANDVAVRNGIPYIYGGAVGTTGMCMPILPRTPDGNAAWEQGVNEPTPCFRCLFEEPPAPGSSPTCDTIGVLGPAVNVIASLEVAEALKILTGNLDAVSRSLVTIDLWSNTLLQLDADAIRDDCPCCADRRFDYLEGRSGSNAATLCGREAVQLRHAQSAEEIDMAALAARLREHGEVRANAFMLRAGIRDGGHSYELTLFPDGRAIIKGTTDIAVARGLYARFIGS